MVNEVWIVVTDATVSVVLVACFVCEVPATEVQSNPSTSVAVKDEDKWIDKSTTKYAWAQSENLMIQSE